MWSRLLYPLGSPVDTHEISAFVEMLVECAVKGALGGGANPARQVNVCRMNDDALRLFIDTDDAVERMLALFGFFLMTRQTNDLILLLRSEGAAQFDDAG